MKFTLSYSIEDHGWANATLRSENDIYEIDAISYLSDAFEELSLAVLDVLNGIKEASCGFDHEPGRTKIRFLAKDEMVQIQIYEFQNEMRDEPWEKGKAVQSFETRILRLKSQYLETADKILREHGVAEYKVE
ncbi:hypothetical protein BTA51_17795 [Hahella sp. CCB-MM4]|uniref:hypothetical protein n=1 Tax=Hahella sp. (strain CCB-MM4) TaxID=1926491 RepID=UPI000B9A39EC|nr:hypothetical protein [Hahella sp. CCB-MM4]OZG72200.1 hypothetical protein BTA51_17795 [Hahella sp. CCB-MM4]